MFSCVIFLPYPWYIDKVKVRILKIYNAVTKIKKKRTICIDKCSINKLIAGIRLTIVRDRNNYFRTNQTLTKNNKIEKRRWTSAIFVRNVARDIRTKMEGMNRSKLRFHQYGSPSLWHLKMLFYIAASWNRRLHFGCRNYKLSIKYNFQIINVILFVEKKFNVSIYYFSWLTCTNMFYSTLDIKQE